MEKRTKTILIILAVLILGILAWGLIGANKSSYIGTTCDFGIGDSLCWKWHTNTIGQISDSIKNMLG